MKTVVVLEHAGNAGADGPQGRDVWWKDVVAGQGAECPAEPMDAEDPLFVLYTSGSTGKPKGIVHTTGGYMVGTYLTTQYVFDLQEKDVYWCTADVGWITGHSYVVYGPLAEWRDDADVRGRAELPGFLPILGDDRAAQGERLLHRADGDPRVHEGRA